MYYFFILLIAIISSSNSYVVRPSKLFITAAHDNIMDRKTSIMSISQFTNQEMIDIGEGSQRDFFKSQHTIVEQKIADDISLSKHFADSMTLPQGSCLNSEQNDGTKDNKKLLIGNFETVKSSYNSPNNREMQTSSNIFKREDSSLTAGPLTSKSDFDNEFFHEGLSLLSEAINYAQTHSGDEARYQTLVDDVDIFISQIKGQIATAIDASGEEFHSMLGFVKKEMDPEKKQKQKIKYQGQFSDLTIIQSREKKYSIPSKTSNQNLLKKIQSRTAGHNEKNFVDKDISVMKVNNVNLDNAETSPNSIESITVKVAHGAPVRNDILRQILSGIEQYSSIIAEHATYGLGAAYSLLNAERSTMLDNFKSAIPDPEETTASKSSSTKIIVPPAQDPFYTGPDGWKDHPVGTILKHRQVSNPKGFSRLSQNLNGTYQILFRSNSSLGEPLAAVTTVFVPQGADFSKLVSYQVAEDSVNLNCSPSYNFQLSFSSEGSNTQAEFLLIESLLNEGLIVSSPDHEGPNSAFGAGLLAGQITLDSLRAVLQSTEFTGIQKDAAIVAWGYSGGTIPTAWAAQAMATYAPELKITGIAIGGVVANITAVFDYDNNGPYAGLIGSGLKGISNEYPDINDYLQKELTYSGKQAFQQLEGLCLAQLASPVASQFYNHNVFNYFENKQQFLYGEAFTNILLQNILGRVRPQVPVYMYQSDSDQIVPATTVDALYEMWCALGANVEYHADIASGHISEVIYGAPGASSWIQGRLNGDPIEVGCHKNTTWTNDGTPNDISELGAAVAADLSDLMGGKVGPD